MDKDLRKVVQALRDAGFQVVTNRKGFPEVYTPDGEWITTLGASSRDKRGWLNALAPLKRRGFVWPPKG